MAQLEKTLSSKVLLLITLNSIIGSGMFFLPAIGARVAGPASIISWIIISLISIYSAACFGELVGMYPKSGGVYEYTKQAFGTFPSFLMGWIAWLIGNITTAMLIVGAITYLLPIATGTTLLFKIGASIFWVLVLNYMTYRGLKTSAVMLVSFAVVTLTILLFLIIPAWIDVPSLMAGHLATSLSLTNIIPFFTHHGLVPNILALALTIFLISETFFGVESVCFLAGETKEPEKVLPRVLVKAMLIISVLAVLLVMTSLLVIPAGVFGGVDPLPVAAQEHFGTTLQAPYAYLAWILFGNIGRLIFTLGAYLVIIGAAAGWVVTGPRLILSLAEDRMFPHQLAVIHDRYRTPHKAILFQTVASILFVLVALLSGSSGYERLLEMLVPLVLFMMAVIVLIVPILRKRQPKTLRPYNVLFPKVGPILLSFFYLALIAMWMIESGGHAWEILRLSLSFVAMGIPIYLLLMIYYNPEAIIRFTEIFAYFSLWLENILLPKRIRREIIMIFKELEEKRVLDYGAGVGTLTMHLAEKVGPRGKVYATDISAKNLRILDRRLKKRGFTHVATIHDPHQVNRLHPEIKEVDIIFSVGMLSYIQDLQKVLKDIHRILPESGKVCFVEYVDYFRVLPNPKWLDDPITLKELFQEAGFSVQVVKNRGLFWNYLFIYGEKSSHAKEKLPYI